MKAETGLDAGQNAPAQNRDGYRSPDWAASGPLLFFPQGLRRVSKMRKIFSRRFAIAVESPHAHDLPLEPHHAAA